ncbi:MAG: rhodanese-like domain-containing protein [Actinomycetota bacterium]
MDVVALRRKGLGNTSYLVGVGGNEAIVVDPDRTGRYAGEAKELGLTIVAVLETHLHADFVTGSLELADSLGAEIFAPKEGAFSFPHRPVVAGEILEFGHVRLEAIASPGHTPEHLSYVAYSPEAGAALFSGGALIAGGAARTDLIDLGRTDELTRAEFHTIHEAFAGLGDETRLYPTHGAGSYCSSGDRGRKPSTIGEERLSNPLLKVRDEDEFAAWFPTTFPATPAYFPRMREFNRRGPRLVKDIAAPPPLGAEEFMEASNGGMVVDARPSVEYLAAHIPGSLAIPHGEDFPLWLGWLAPADSPLFFVVGDVPLRQVVDDALLVGLETLGGYLAVGPGDWLRAGVPSASIASIEPPDARGVLGAGARALDVREPAEYASGHIEGAKHIPLGALSDRIGELAEERPLIAYCSAGNRSTTALSILERNGVGPPARVLSGGFRAWEGG